MARGRGPGGFRRTPLSIFMRLPGRGRRACAVRRDGVVDIAHPPCQREVVMENVSVLHRIVKAPVLPELVQRRVDKFHNERVAIDWGGRHILRGRRPTDTDLMLQSNDYLSIAGHPDIVEAQREALATGGLGMMMSALFQQHADDP